MKLSIQRHCDGISALETCEAELELSVTHVDVALKVVDATVDAWEQAAAIAGWRRTNGPGENIDVGFHGDDSARIFIPSARAWVVCPACATRLKLVCSRCGNAECSCIGGPRFDARAM